MNELKFCTSALRATATCLLLAALCSSSPMFAQTTAEADATKDPTRIKLARIVHLDFNDTTVSAVMKELSNQTGLVVQPAVYLAERKLSIHMVNVSAAEVLDSLDELSDWTWYPTTPGVVLLTRRRLRLDSTAASIPRMMRASIPKDIRTYLHIPTPTENAPTMLRLLDRDLHEEMSFSSDRLWSTVARDQSALLTSLAPGILNGETVTYNNLTESQRTELLISLVFPLFWKTDYELLYGDILPHIEDVRNATLHMSGVDTLLIGSRVSDGKIKTEAGFGANIK